MVLVCFFYLFYVCLCYVYLCSWMYVYGFDEPINGKWVQGMNNLAKLITSLKLSVLGQVCLIDKNGAKAEKRIKWWVISDQRDRSKVGGQSRCFCLQECYQHSSALFWPCHVLIRVWFVLFIVTCLWPSTSSQKPKSRTLFNMEGTSYATVVYTEHCHGKYMFSPTKMHEV